MLYGGPPIPSHASGSIGSSLLADYETVPGGLSGTTGRQCPMDSTSILTLMGRPPCGSIVVAVGERRIA